MSRENLLSDGKNTGFNYQMCTLSAIAMIFVIFGHIYKGEYAIGTFYNWFPYYSFHLPIFIFISGYFFKDPKLFDTNRKFTGHRTLLSFFLKKCRTLLLPYFVINGIFLLINTYLRTLGFTYGTPFSLKEWLINPWLNCYSVTYSVPTWYLIGFFYAEIYFVVIRMIAGLLIKNEKEKEILLLVLTLAIGIISVQYCNTNHVSQTSINFLRAAAMLFFLEFGVIYRKYLEKADRLSSIWYFIILLAVQLAMLIFSGNSLRAPALFNMSGFGAYGYDYFIGGMTGLLIWLRVARIIARYPKRSRLLIFIGNNTKYIMAFHIFGFFLLNYGIYFLRTQRIRFALIDNFSRRDFHTFLYYFVPDVRMLLLYFFAGLGLSLLLAKLIGLAKSGIKAIISGRVRTART